MTTSATSLVTGAVDGQVLAYNGADWVAVSPASLAVDVDLDYTAAADGGTVTNTAGDDAEIPMADGTTAGLSLNNFTEDDKTKLDGIDLQIVTDKGNNTTNSITLDTDKIVLNPDGSATFSQRITSGSDNNRGQFLGTCPNTVTASTADAFVARYESTDVFSVKYDGSATFEGKLTVNDQADIYRKSTEPTNAVLALSSDIGGTKTRKATVRADGSAEFADKVISGETGIGNTGAYLQPSGAVFSRVASSEISALTVRTSADNTDKAVIYGDGSATFAGQITANEGYALSQLDPLP